MLLDRVGRRTLLLTGTVGLTIALAVLGIYFTSSTLQQKAGWVALAALLVYIASFAIGLGPVFWLMISEIYPTGIRSKAMSVATVANWGANFLVAVTFLSLGQAITRQGTFFLYTGLGVLAFMFFLSRVPETSNRSLEDIQQQLTGGRAE
jgi:MFS family permease